MGIPPIAAAILSDSSRWLIRDRAIVYRLNSPKYNKDALCLALSKVDQAIAKNTLAPCERQWGLLLDYLVFSVATYHEAKKGSEDTPPTKRRSDYQTLTNQMRDVAEMAGKLAEKIKSIGELAEQFDPADIADIDVPVNPLQWLNDTVYLKTVDSEARERYKGWIQADVERLAYLGCKYVPTISDMLTELSNRYQHSWEASQSSNTPIKSPKSRYNDFLSHFFSELHREAKRNQLPEQLLLNGKGLSLPEWADILGCALDEQDFKDQNLKDFMRRKSQ
ncbi:hypothetical protein [Methylotuvimicrobium alcaliphilum]|uniref:Uncharacterized protein n=1 Tax=Methylotuvimicrobium alcaliphilum (strain DSM 19304 / NCIMB 14124 / VKM B-2133 / 20Z) TaxID=1091494 RepID=G4SVC0_META2|nr:hypothetical protein [Methylotuvimicrobium alcaliphilum]CCE21896.1 protein of unknown function [Methylotuvimicrobium alcaliphilum 20Z]